MESSSRFLVALSCQLRSIRFLCLVVIVCGAASAGAFRFDASISAYSRQIDVPGDIEKAIQLSEVFGHSLGVGAILFTAFWIAVDRRRQLIGAALLTLSAGLTANLLKASVSRVRPHSLPLIELLPQRDGQAASQTEELLERVEGNPTPRIPISELRFWDSRQRSFPSGHAATAWGLAIGLSLVFPRGVLLFALFASLACFQRIFSGAHYASDVLAGTAIAFAWGAIWLLLARRNARFAVVFPPPDAPCPGPLA